MSDINFIKYKFNITNRKQSNILRFLIQIYLFDWLFQPIARNNGFGCNSARVRALHLLAYEYIKQWCCVGLCFI